METTNSSEVPQERLEKPPPTGKLRRKKSRRRDEMIENASRLATGLSRKEMLAIIDGAQDQLMTVADHDKLKAAMHALIREVSNLPD